MSRSPARPLRSGAQAITFTLLLLLPALSQAQQGVSISEQDGLLSVRAANTPASELAETLSRELGISVVVTGDAETRVNVDIIEEPLDKALAKLSPNHMLVRSDRPSDNRIVEVVLMMGEGTDSNSGGAGEQFLPSGSPADDVVISDEAPLEGDTSGATATRSEGGRPGQNGEKPGAGPPPDGGAPAPESFDPVSGQAIDPQTGQPIQ